MNSEIIVSFTLLSIALLSISHVAVLAAEDGNVAAAFKKAGIVPDIIDLPPEKLITVKYDSDSIEVNLGNEVTPTQVKLEPSTISWKSVAEPNKFYLLYMSDPDVLSRHFHPLREAKHWMIGNIPGDDISKGEVLTSYVGPGPLPGFGLHRYTFLVYEQPSGNVTFLEPRITPDSGPSTRVRFSIRKFSEKYKLGQPVAGNFLQAKFDAAAAQEMLRQTAEAARETLSAYAENARHTLTGFVDTAREKLRGRFSSRQNSV